MRITDSEKETDKRDSNIISLESIAKLGTIAINTLFENRLFETWLTTKICIIRKSNTRPQTVFDIGKCFSVRISHRHLKDFNTP
jgi:hypothetical protein